MQDGLRNGGPAALIFEYEYHSSVFIFEYLTEYIRIPIRISYLK